MELNELTKKIESMRKGQIVTLRIRRRISLAKKYGDIELIKESLVQGLIKADYDNRKIVIEKRANGQGRRQGTLTEVIKDTIYVNAQGEYQLRILPIASGNARSRFILNGEETPKEVLLNMFPKSYIEGSGETPDCLHVKISNLVEIR